MLSRTGMCWPGSGECWSGSAGGCPRNGKSPGSLSTKETRRLPSAVDSEVVVHFELVRVRAEADRVDVVVLQADPRVQQVRGEDVTGKQELAVLAECGQGRL